MPVCPLMSFANQGVTCNPNCALWRPNEGNGGQCGVLSPADKIEQGLNEIASLIRDIRGKL